MTPLQTETAKSIVRKIKYWVEKKSTVFVVYSN